MCSKAGRLPLRPRRLVVAGHGRCQGIVAVFAKDGGGVFAAAVVDHPIGGLDGGCPRRDTCHKTLPDILQYWLRRRCYGAAAWFP